MTLPCVPTNPLFGEFKFKTFPIKVSQLQGSRPLAVVELVELLKVGVIEGIKDLT